MDYSDAAIAAITSLEEARAHAAACPRCDLARTRRRVVFGAGDLHARLMIVGEAPAEHDEVTGLPFSGPTGGLLEHWLAASGLTRDQVWLTNTVRCRPTMATAGGAGGGAPARGGRAANRPPRVGELRACAAWLQLEERLVAPEVIVTLGATAGKALLGKPFALANARGEWQERPATLDSFAAGTHPAPVLPTYHPAYILRLEGDDALRAQALVDADLQRVRARLDAPPSLF